MLSFRKFSSLANDRVHEQCNCKRGRIVGGTHRGIVGITDSDSALNRCTVGGPELARLLNKFDAKYSAHAKITKPTMNRYPVFRKSFCLM